ncbi:MAG: heme-binding protein [Pseudomonadota bacterium]
MAVLNPFALGLIGAGLLAAGAVFARASQHVATPSYMVEHRDGNIEVRAYPELVLAQVTRSGARRSAVQSAFPALARYIFAKNRPGDKIAMTAPVVQVPVENNWVVSFIMPNGSKLEDLPAPQGDVRLLTQPARRMAAIRFSGRWTDKKFADITQQLQVWMDAAGLRDSGPPEYAYYNDPMTPASLRRNEILIELAR